MPDEIHLPMAKFMTGDAQPDLEDVRSGLVHLYEETWPSELEDQRNSIAEEYWTIRLSEMAHCGVKKYGDVNNLDKRRLNIHERVIESIKFIPSGCMVDQYPLGGIFTTNPFHEVVVGYVFTAWKNVSTLQQNGISHIAKFTKLVEAPPPRVMPGAPFLTKEKAAREISVDMAFGLRDMLIYVSDEGTTAAPQFGVILQDVLSETCYRLDLIKLREVQPLESPSISETLGTFFEQYTPNFGYLDDLWESQ